MARVYVYLVLVVTFWCGVGTGLVLHADPPRGSGASAGASDLTMTTNQDQWSGQVKKESSTSVRLTSPTSLTPEQGVGRLAHHPTTTTGEPAATEASEASVKPRVARSTIRGGGRRRHRILDVPPLPCPGTCEVRTRGICRVSLTCLRSGRHNS